MNKMNKITLLIAIAMIAFTVKSYGQETTSATSTATIIAPIAIAKATDLNFGNVAVQSTTGGTVVLTADANKSRSATGGVTLPATNGTVAAAAFNVTGEGGYTYTIGLPSAAISLSDGATTASTMSVDTFKSTPAATGTLSTAGAQTIYVGATLHVAAKQTPGIYTNTGGLTVTVNYN